MGFKWGNIASAASKLINKIPQVVETVGHCRNKNYAKCGQGIIGHVGDVGDVLGSLKKGGRINKTGVYRLHKGELVLPAAAAAKVMRGVHSKKQHRGVKRTKK